MALAHEDAEDATLPNRRALEAHFEGLPLLARGFVDRHCLLITMG